jgi:Tol biopolymer transport system component
MIIWSCQAGDGTTEPPGTGKIPITEETPLVEITTDDEFSYLQPREVPEDKETQFYTVQVGAFSNIENALNTLTELKEEGFDVFLFQDTTELQTLYKVGVGSFDTEVEAEMYLETFSVPGYEGMWVTLVRSGPVLEYVPPDVEAPDSEVDESPWHMAYVSDRDGEWGVWFQREGEEPLLLIRGNENLKRPRISPDVTKVAFLRMEDEADGGSLVIVSTDGTDEEFVIPSPLPLHHHLWIAKNLITYVSTSVAEHTSHKIITYDIDIKGGEILFSTGSHRIKDLSLSPDGRYLAYHATQGIMDSDTDEAVHVGVINIETGEKNVIRAGYTTRFLGWLPDNSLIICYHQAPGSGTRFDYSLAQVDPGGKDIILMEGVKPIKNIGSGTTSPDGRFIAFTTFEVDTETGEQIQKSIYLFDREEKKAKRLVSKEHDISRPSWSPAGDEIVFSTKDRAVVTTFVIKNLTAPSTRRLFEGSVNAFDLDWK